MTAILQSTGAKRPEWTGPFDIEIDCVAVTKSWDQR
jgi:hypothetical protein